MPQRLRNVHSPGFSQSRFAHNLRLLRAAVNRKASEMFCECDLLFVMTGLDNRERDDVTIQRIDAALSPFALRMRMARIEDANRVRGR
jgi:hypothetical protein